MKSTCAIGTWADPTTGDGGEKGAPFLDPSRLCRLLAHSHVAPFARPNSRACSQARKSMNPLTGSRVPRLQDVPWTRNWLPVEY